MGSVGGRGRGDLLVLVICGGKVNTLRFYLLLCGTDFAMLLRYLSALHSMRALHAIRDLHALRALPALRALCA